MKSARWWVFPCLLLIWGCGARATANIRIIDGDLVRSLNSGEGSVPAILSQAGISLQPGDQLLLDGYAVPMEAAVPAAPVHTFQIIHAKSVSINGKSLKTTAASVGEALAAAGIPLYRADSLAPPADHYLSQGAAIRFAPSQELSIAVDGKQVRIRSAAPTIGQALAAAGMPLQDLDYSRPAQGEPLPADGQVRVVRVSESVVLAQKAIPFESQSTDSPDVELGQEKVIQAGIPGLAVSRVRIRYEDGQEVSSRTESETVVRPPQTRISARGTKIVMQTAAVNGNTIQYWRVLQMYATVYSPCNSTSGGCSSGTASGLRAGKGVVAVDPALYAYLNGQRLYIPGYGYAVVGDIGGGYIVEKNTGVSRYRWIDLGFDDNNITDMTGWVTVYFLAPAPATIPDVLK